MNEKTKKRLEDMEELFRIGLATIEEIKEMPEPQHKLDYERIEKNNLTEICCMRRLLEIKEAIMLYPLGNYANRD